MYITIVAGYPSTTRRRNTSARSILFSTEPNSFSNWIRFWYHWCVDRDAYFALTGISLDLAHCSSFNKAVHQTVRRQPTGRDPMEMIPLHGEPSRQRVAPLWPCNSADRSSGILDQYSPKTETRLSHARYYAGLALTGICRHSIKPRGELMGSPLPNRSAALPR